MTKVRITLYFIVSMCVNFIDGWFGVGSPQTFQEFLVKIDIYIFLREVVQICAVVRTQGEAKVDVERSLVLVVSAKVEGGDPSD